MQVLFEQFLKEKQYLKNVTPKTLSFFKQSLKVFTRFPGEIEPSALDHAKINELVVNMRESGLSAISCNTYISGINSYLTWLPENEHTGEHLKVKLLREEKRVIQVLSDDQIKAMLSWKPQRFSHWRSYILVALIARYRAANRRSTEHRHAPSRLGQYVYRCLREGKQGKIHSNFF